jgi:hypothetical protein
MSNYETFLRSSTSEEILEEPLAADFISLTWLERRLDGERQLNRETVQGLQAEDGGSAEDYDFGDVPMPQIEYKSAVTRGLKIYLDGLRESHRLKIKEENNRDAA